MFTDERELPLRKRGKKMKLYIYSNETDEHEATITGETNEACEAKAEEVYGSNDYYWTYTDSQEIDDSAEEIEA